jgi:hypothetical protein
MRMRTFVLSERRRCNGFLNVRRITQRQREGLEVLYGRRESYSGIHTDRATGNDYYLVNGESDVLLSTIGIGGNSSFQSRKYTSTRYYRLPLVYVVVVIVYSRVFFLL